MPKTPSLEELKEFVGQLLPEAEPEPPPVVPPEPPAPNSSLAKVLEEVPIPEGGFMPKDSGDVELRRQRVLQLRFRKMTEPAIAAVVGVDRSTVSRDLKWWRDEWRQTFGGQPSFDPSEMIGESMEAYRDAESLAMLEFSRLGATEEVEVVDEKGNKKKVITRTVSPLLAARSRMAALRTAVLCRKEQVTLLQENGLMQRQLGTVGIGVTVEDAQALRNRLRAVGALQDLDLVSDGERAWVGAAAGTPEAE